jgi:imidazolonepropionase-like amidohydrolase
VSRLLLRRANVLDPDGAHFRGVDQVVVDDGIIVAIGSGEPALAPGDRELDIAGGYLVPGLIDSHFHLVSRSAELVDEDLVALGMVEGTVNAAERLAAGVTAVRDCGCRHRGIFALTSAIESGLIRGPRAYVAGTNPTGPTAPAHWRNVVAHDAAELRAVIRQQVADGAHWVKLILAHAEDPADWSAVSRYLTDAEIAAGVDEAHRLGVKIGCHCEGWEVSAAAVAAGMDALDHAPLVSAETAAQMAERGTVYVPTVWAFSGDAGVDLDSLPTARRDAIRRWQDEHRASVGRAHAAGVTIAAGSDAEGSLPDRGVLVEEMLALRDCGLSTVEVLAAATRSGAGLIGHTDDLGVLRVGALADLVAVQGNPLDDIAELRNPTVVVARGHDVRDQLGGRAIDDTIPSGARDLVVSTSRWLP